MYNGVLGVGGILIAVLLYFLAYPDNTGLRFAVGTVALVATLLLVLLLTFADAAYELYKQGPNVSPKGSEKLRGLLPVVTPAFVRIIGMPSCVAKQVTRPIRNREAPAPEPHL